MRRYARLKPQQIFLAVHRVEFTVYYRRLDADEFRLLQAIGQGRAIGAALDFALRPMLEPQESPDLVCELGATGMALPRRIVMQKIQKLYEMFVRAASSLESPFLLIVRLYWGWQFMQTGWGKLGDLGKVTNYFTTLGIPAPALNATSFRGSNSPAAYCLPSVWARA